MQELNEIQNNFLSELHDSLEDQKTSLPFIVQRLPSSSLVKNNELFQVLVIGGSVCKIAIVKRHNNDIVLLSQTQTTIPHMQTKQDFLKFLEPLIEKDIQTLALNFAYPLNPVFESGKLDGILISGSKENTFEGLVGKQLGREIEQYIQQTQKRTFTVSVANDTICLLLSGLTKYSFERLAAGVVGTGINFALFLEENKVVNLESANFDKFKLSKQAKEIDQSSTHPGKALFEKETAGAYLYQHFNLLEKEKNITFSPLTSTEQLSELAENNKSEQGKLAQEILKHSAKLVACQIAAIAEFKNKDMVFVMEGSLFWDAYQYKEIIEQTIIELVPQYKVQFVHIENSSILGAAELIA